MSEPKRDTLAVPGAVLHYDVRANDASAQPVLLLIGSPMGADGFAELAGCFDDRTVVTYDPRGVGRSQRADGASGSPPGEHADDLHRLIGALGAGPVDVFGSSGGAVNGLALVARHPEQVRTLVAHEPPIAQVLPDRDALLATCEAIHETYLRDGFGPAMAKFIAMVSQQGPLPDDFASRPGPDPAELGLPTADDGSRDHPLLGRHMILCTHYQHDFAALAATPVRIVPGVGAASAAMMPGRAAVAVAARLGPAPVTFPGNHNGFGGQSDAFAVTLRQVLAG
ncbi:MAG TPA: alpha/beta hydrolase [Streptosporangiaceae bacterium]|jgi:pimeloyl-ACP methyl ester carboxylesterase|nr:alpha/beta hydrolase [Streptosporangiaceae bacterium]